MSRKDSVVEKLLEQNVEGHLRLLFYSVRFIRASLGIRLYVNVQFNVAIAYNIEGFL